MNTHEHENYPLEPPVHDDYGPPDPEELTLTTEDHTDEVVDQVDVSEHESPEQLGSEMDGPAVGRPQLDGGANTAVEVPEAVKARTTQATNRPVGRGVEWVRPTDLMARQGAAVAGRGIDFQTALTLKARHGATVAARRVGDRVARLSPLSAFGRARGQSAPGRAAVGMS